MKNLLLPSWLKITLFMVAIISAVNVLAFGYLTAKAAFGQPLNPLVEIADVDLQLDQDAPPAVPTMVVGESSPTPLPTSLPWRGTDRVNILLMGIDRRPGEPFISRTDSMLIISINPETEKVSILSVPRDLYVMLPGRGRDRINTAFVYGAAGNNPAGGAALAMQTVEYNLGIPIDHYVLVDFSAVINGVDLLGGVDVNVPYTINDPTYPSMNYGYDPLYIPAGLQHLDGTMALKYARTRHQDMDFGRSRRQQQLILAVRDKAVALGIGGMLQQAPSFYQQLEQGIRTDLSMDQMIRLATTLSGIPSANIHSEVLDQRYVSGHTTEQGAQVLVLNNNVVAPLIQQMFYND